MHDKMHPPGLGAMTDGHRKVLALTHAMDGSQHGRLKRTASRVPCAGGCPGWRDRHASAYADGSRACGHDDGCWAGTYACSRVDPHAGGGVISDARSPGPISTPSGAGAEVGERFVDGHRSFTDLRPVNTRRMSRRPTSQRYGWAGDRSNRRSFHAGRHKSSRHAAARFILCAERLLWSGDAASVRAVFGLFHSPPGGPVRECRGAVPAPHAVHTCGKLCGLRSVADARGTRDGTRSR